MAALDFAIPPQTRNGLCVSFATSQSIAPISGRSKKAQATSNQYTCSKYTMSGYVTCGFPQEDPPNGTTHI